MAGLTGRRARAFNVRVIVIAATAVALIAPSGWLRYTVWSFTLALLVFVAVSSRQALGDWWHARVHRDQAQAYAHVTVDTEDAARLGLLPPSSWMRPVALRTRLDAQLHADEAGLHFEPGLIQAATGWRSLHLTSNDVAAAQLELDSQDGELQDTGVLVAVTSDMLPLRVWVRQAAGELLATTTLLSELGYETDAPYIVATRDDVIFESRPASAAERALYNAAASAADSDEMFTGVWENDGWDPVPPAGDEFDLISRTQLPSASATGVSGWLDDPLSPGLSERYYDGRGWTAETRIKTHPDA